MINRVIVLSTLILAFALTINWFMTESEETADFTPGNEPDLYMLNATISQFGSDGELQHRITANRFTHFPLTDLTTMKSPALALGRTQDANPWEITSIEGRILPLARRAPDQPGETARHQRPPGAAGADAGEEERRAGESGEGERDGKVHPEQQPCQPQ